MASEHGEITGVVDDIDADDVARVLIGDAREEWFFPLSMLPLGTKVGEELLFSDESGRYVAVEPPEDSLPVRTIEGRLSRPISTKKTSELDRDELSEARADALAGNGDDPVATGREEPRSPVRTRASHQRRW